MELKGKKQPKKTAFMGEKGTQKGREELFLDITVSLGFA
jgi:hypothetical protein